MKILVTILSILVATAGLAQTPAGRSGGSKPVTQGTSGSETDALALQVMLDRAGFSPGEIDGRPGSNFKRAVSAFQRSNGLPDTGQVDEQTRERLAGGMANQPVVIEYEVTDADVAGPFTASIPADLVQQSKLDTLGYRRSSDGTPRGSRRTARRPR